MWNFCTIQRSHSITDISERAHLHSLIISLHFACSPSCNFSWICFSSLNTSGGVPQFYKGGASQLHLAASGTVFHFWICEPMIKNFWVPNFVLVYIVFNNVYLEVVSFRSISALSLNTCVCFQWKGTLALFFSFVKAKKPNLFHETSYGNKLISEQNVSNPYWGLLKYIHLCKTLATF